MITRGQKNSSFFLSFPEHGIAKTSDELREEVIYMLKLMTTGNEEAQTTSAMLQNEKSRMQQNIHHQNS